MNSRDIMFVRVICEVNLVSDEMMHLAKDEKRRTTTLDEAIYQQHQLTRCPALEEFDINVCASKESSLEISFSKFFLIDMEEFN
jgi:hypothetical protein